MFTANKTNCSQLHSSRHWHLSSLSLQRSLIRMPVQFVTGQRCNIITHTITPFTTAHTKCTLSSICSRRRCLCFQYIETAKHLDAVQTEHKKMFQCIWRLFDYSRNRKETKIMPTIDMYATGQNIKSMVKKQKITVNKMQEAFGFNTPQAIYKWYRGDAMPTIDNFIILAAVLNTTIDNIIVTTTAA